MYLQRKKLFIISFLFLISLAVLSLLWKRCCLCGFVLTYWIFKNLLELNSFICEFTDRIQL